MPYLLFALLTQVESERSSNAAHLYHESPAGERTCRLRVQPGPVDGKTATFASAVNEETPGLAALRLIYRTFVALDIYRGSGGP